MIQIDTEKNRVNQDFNAAVRNSYLFFPAISVDIAGNLNVIYGFSNMTFFPSLLVSQQAIGDPANSLQSPVLLQQGSGADKSGRFGDYFAVANSPEKQSEFWVAGQYTPASSSRIFWSTFIGNFSTISSEISPTITSPTITI